MYSLRLTCRPEDVERISAELWEEGTAGIRELEIDKAVLLIAAFETNARRVTLLSRYGALRPEWEHLENVDWVQQTRDAWPPRLVGDRFLVCPPWYDGSTPEGRLRLVHNPGLACGTGEHPCTQLALIALESCVDAGSRWLDVGTGSAMLAIAALQLGAAVAAGLDNDATALASAAENAELNDVAPLLAAGSADCVRDGWADGVVANISGTVLLSILDDLIRVLRSNAWLVLTGFTESELAPFQALLPGADVLSLAEWRCVVARFSSSA